ncbi:BON domain-containing protein [Plantactinospora sp. KBS50]|uniref:BON domain-containing protein n=1 Tax=Plantactinospora sp. KBS50 TaxID=2024580 RepID=UPI001E46CADD|nr:BON domain-containing protein [Plantactinospora sp. KBS50]
MMVTTMARNDEAIQRNILAELDWDPQVRPNEIGVTVSDGVVALTGWVDSYARKWAAERAAHRLSGVRAVANDIAVRLSTATGRTDAEIATSVTRALEWDAFIPADGLSVTVANGWVVLRGEVEWEYQRRAAERSVRRLTGVQGLTNGIQVRPRVRPSAEELRHRLVTALVRTVSADAQQLGIEVDDGTVTLRGTVRSALERQEAERVAWSGPGVEEVRNELVVQG